MHVQSRGTNTFFTPMMLHFTPTSAIYFTHTLLAALTSSFLFWRAQQVPQKKNMLRAAAATFMAIGIALFLTLIEISLAEPHNYYATFFIMSAMALISLPLLVFIYHLPVWSSRHRREFQFAFGFMLLRLLYELHWGIVRTWSLATEGVIIERRPLFADLLLLMSVIWLTVSVVAQVRRSRQQLGKFVIEGLLVLALTIPPAIGVLLYTLHLIDHDLLAMVRDVCFLLNIPLVILIFLDLFPEAISLMVRMLAVALVLVFATINVAALLLGLVLSDAYELHQAVQLLMVLAVVTTLLLSASLPLLLWRSVFGPLHALLRGVRQVQSGALDVQVPVSFANEMGELTNAFNRMVAQVRTTVNGLEQRVRERTVDLKRSETRYRELVEQIDEVIFRLGMPEAWVEYVSPSVERMLGYPVARVLQGPLFLGEFLHPDDRPLVLTQMQALAQGEIRPQYEYRVFDAHGRERWLQQSNTGIYVGDHLVAIEGICRDATEAKLNESLMLTQQRELAALRERERISRDLHDGLGQTMGYVNLQTQTATTLIQTGKVTQAQHLLNQVKQVAQHAHSDVRRYILDLRLPAVELAHSTWMDTLRQQMENFSQMYGLELQLSCSPSFNDDGLVPELGQEILQIIQEALNNVQKHARVNAAQVVVQQRLNQVSVTIADQGVGFSPGAPEREADAQGRQGGLGLRSMGERAALIGASLQIDSAPGAGTHVVLTVPLPSVALEHVPAHAQDYGAHAQPLRVLLVDDHALFLDGLRNMLAVRGMQVVGMAHDGLEAQALAQQLRPDIILMDMHMPRCDGLAATAAIKTTLPSVKILMLTVDANEASLFAALRVGATGYLLKSLESADLFNLIMEATRGEVVLSQGLAAQTLAALEAEAAPTLPNDPRLTKLSPRQRDILERVANYQTYREIAREFNVSEATIKYHMGQIVEQLQVANRREAIALVRQG
ncbi:MAG: response regulator [Candidatus Viridilinea halotolerans]|uniref:histidine kinase n=1 Tax=Candidatus Viridilinea halotolerans TaxID=2491704 RepID=A0A426U0P3_9CHLR|nr:MAG: response regulator [Candidatus Viridilinea halotolerans]